VLLLDTNIVYRWLMALPISRAVARRIRSEGAMVSILCPWEMLIKHQIGKLHLPTLDVAGDIEAQGFALLAIKPVHLLALSALPPLHRDPFDRLLLAQAQAEGATFVTTDATLTGYPADILLV
jgi:PIN domain nuclease of toxin-antitoxin system